MRSAPGAPFLLPALAFLLALLGAIGSAGTYHGDERFYTDAALAMRREGDPWTPRYADGTPRLNKPLLTYWLIAGSQALLGIGLFSARLPFALAGAGVVYLSGRLALRLSGDPLQAQLAALVMAAQPDLCLLSTRSTPDVTVCLAAALAAYGLAHLARPECAPAGARHFWLGVGLATAAKGLWGLLLAAYGLFLLRRARLDAGARRAWLGARALVPAALLAGLGTVPLLLTGGRAAVQSGAEDQLRASPGAATVLHNLLEYAPAPWIHLLPWTLVLVPVLLRAPRTWLAQALRRPHARAALGWFLLLALVFLPGTQRRTRYLAPAYAPLCVLLVGLLVERARAQDPWIRRASLALLGICGGLLGAAAVLLRAAGPLSLALAVLGLGALALLGWVRTRPAERALQAAAWSVLVCTGVALGWVRPTLVQAPFAAIAARVGSRTLALGAVEPSDGARLRLATGDRARTLEIADPRVHTGVWPEVALTRAASEAAWVDCGYVVAERFEPPGGPDGRALLRAFRTGTFPVASGPTDERLVLLEWPGSTR